MTNFSRTRLSIAVVALVALVAAGAAVAATHHHNGLRTSHTLRHAARAGGHDHGAGPGGQLAAVTSYLGISADTLRADLQSGKTLAQAADATPGKSAAGLIAALVTADQAKLAAAVTAGKLTQAQSDAISSKLTAAVTALVNGTRPGGRGGRHGGPGGGLRGAALAASASYLGVSTDSLRTSLQSGKTLAQIADATSGKSAAGLIAALVADAKAKLAAAVTAGKLTQTQSDKISAALTARVTDFVNGTRSAKHAFRHTRLARR